MQIYDVTLKNGTKFSVEAPYNATNEQIIAAYNSRIQDSAERETQARLARSRQGFEGSVDAAYEVARNRKAGVLDYLGEIPKGIVSGAASTFENAALGIAALVPETFEDQILRPAIQSVGQAVQDYVAPDFNRGSTLQDSYMRKIPEAGGSFAAIAGTSMLPGGFGLPAAAALAVAQGAGGQRERARAEGVTRDQLNKVTFGGGVVGALELVPIKFLKALGKEGSTEALDRIFRVFSQSGVEAAQETAASILNNAIVRGVYKPEQSLTEGTGEEAILGGSVGAIVQGLVELAIRDKRGTDTDVTPVEEQLEMDLQGGIGAAPRPGLRTNFEGEQGEFDLRGGEGTAPHRQAEFNFGKPSSLDPVQREGVFREAAQARSDKAPFDLVDRMEDAYSTRKTDINTNEQEVQARAQDRQGLRALKRNMDDAKNVNAFEQPDLFEADLERERRRLGPEELRAAARPAAPRVELDEQGNVREVQEPAETPQTTRPFAGKFGQENLQQTDLLDLIAQQDNAAMRRTRAEAQETDLADRAAAPQVKAAQEAPYRQGAERRKTVVDKVLAESTTSSIVNTEKAIQKALTAAGMTRPTLTKQEKLAVRNKVAEIKQARPLREPDTPTDFAEGTANEEQFVYPANDYSVAAVTERVVNAHRANQEAGRVSDADPAPISPDKGAPAPVTDTSEPPAPDGDRVGLSGELVGESGDGAGRRYASLKDPEGKPGETDEFIALVQKLQSNFDKGVVGFAGRPTAMALRVAKANGIDPKGKSNVDIAEELMTKDAGRFSSKAKQEQEQKDKAAKDAANQKREDAAAPVKLRTVKDNRNSYDRLDLNKTNEYEVVNDPTIKVFKLLDRWIATRDSANAGVVARRDTLPELRLAIAEHLARKPQIKEQDQKDFEAEDAVNQKRKDAANQKREDAAEFTRLREEQAERKAAAVRNEAKLKKPPPAGETGARTQGGGGPTDPERKISRRNLKSFEADPRPPKTEPSAKKLVTLWNENASDAKQEDYKKDDTVRNSINPLNDADNNTIYELLNRKLVGDEELRGGNDTLVNVVAYLSRYPNPIDGMKLAAYDLVNNTPRVDVNVRGASEAYLRAAEMYQYMGGVAKKDKDTGKIARDSKGRPFTSPAERLRNWVNANLSEDGQDRFNREEIIAITSKASRKDSFAGIDNIVGHLKENARQVKILRVLETISQRDKFVPQNLVSEGVVTETELAALLKDKLLEQMPNRTWVYNPPSIQFKGQEYGAGVTEADIVEDRRTIAEYLKDLGIKYEPRSLEAAYVVNTATIHPTVVNALKNGNLQDAMLFVSQTSPNKQVRQLAEKFAGVTGTTKVVIKKNLINPITGKPSAGLFEPRTNTITLDADAGINLHTLMHEMSHAAGSAALDDKSSQLTIKLNELFKRVRGSLSRESGTANLQEFFAEAMANQEFRSELSAINIKGEPVNALQRFFNIMQNFLRKFTGAPSVNLTALQQIDSLTDALLAPSPQSRNASPMGMAMMDTTRKGVQSLMAGFVDGTQKAVSAGSRKQLKNDTKDFFKQTIDKNAKKLLMMLSNGQGMGDIASAVGLGNLGYDLDRLSALQRGSIIEAEAQVKNQIETIMKKLNRGDAAVVEKRINALNTVIYDTNFGATIFQVDPNDPKSEYVKQKGEGKGQSKIDADGNKLADVWQAQRKHWDDMGPVGQEVFNEMRKVYGEQYAIMKDVLFKQVDDSLGDTDTAKALKKTITKQLFDKTKLKVYFPLLRQGDFVLRYDVKNIDQKKRIAKVLQTFETAAERDDAKAIIKANSDYENVTTSDGEMTLAQMQSVPSAFVQNTLDILRKAKVPDSVQKDILQLFIKTLPETSFAKALQGRKGTPGYMKDSVLALKTKAYNIASQAQKIKYSADIRALELKINEAPEPKDPPATWREGKTLSGKLLRGVEQRTLADFEAVKIELRKRAKFAREGADRPNVEAVGRRLNQLAFIYTIGFNASSAMVNLSQIPLFVAPYLGGQYGYSRTHKAIKDAYGMVLKSKSRNGSFNSLFEYYKRDDNGTLQLRDRAELNLPEGAEGDAKYQELGRMTSLIQEARGRGLLQSSALAEAMGLTEYSRIAQSGKIGRAMDNGAVLSAIMFNHGEQMNRQVTLMASFNLALNAKKATDYLTTKKLKHTLQNINKAEQDAAKNKDHPLNAEATSEQLDAAVQEAIYNTQKTNGGTFLESAPRITQQGIGRVAGMYKSYGMQMYYTMMQTAKLAFDGDKGKLFGKEGSVERKAAWRQLIGLHGTAMLFAGVQGLPLYGAVRLITNLFFLDDEQEDFDTIVRAHLGEGWYKGGITAATGLDVSTRVALTGLLLQQNRYNNDPSIEEQAGFYLGGPALSVAKRLIRGIEDLYNGETERSIENLLPAGASNIIKNTFGRYQQDGGAFTRRQDPIYDDLSAGEQFFWALGIAPKEYTLRQDKAMIGKRIDTAVRTKRAKLLKKYYVASRMGDSATMLDIFTQMIDFSTRHPAAAIDGDAIERSMKKHATSSDNMYHGVSFSSSYGDTIRMMLSEIGE